jgi:hypothetical protein
MAGNDTQQKNVTQNTSCKVAAGKQFLTTIYVLHV